MTTLDAGLLRWHSHSVDQLGLVFQQPAEPATVLERHLTGRLRQTVRLIVTDNRRTMVSMRCIEDGLRVRIHRMFLDAPSTVIDALARYLEHREATAAAALKHYVVSRRDHIHKRPRTIRLHARGEIHDLGEILAEVGAAYFPDGIGAVRIAWGQRPPRGRRRTIRLGTYTHGHALVRLHPALDQAFVPRFFVAFVVFHEVLHHVVPPVQRGGRTSHHTPQFRAREKAHPDYDRALAWERKHIDRLLRSGR